MIKEFTHAPFRTNLVSFRTFRWDISWLGHFLQQNDSSELFQNPYFRQKTHLMTAIVSEKFLV